MQTTYRQPGAATTEPTVWIDDGGPDQDQPRHGISRLAGWPHGKLADVEVRWTAGTLEGLKLAGFALWEARTARNADGSPRVNVTFPARQYSVNGERRSFALLREVTPATGTADAWTGPAGKLRALILEAWEMHQEQGQPTSGPNRPARFAPAQAQPLAETARQLADLPADLRPAALAASLMPAQPCTNESTWQDDPARAPQPIHQEQPAPLAHLEGAYLEPAPEPEAQPAQVTVLERCNRCGKDTTPANLADFDMGGVYVRACRDYCWPQLEASRDAGKARRTADQRQDARGPQRRAARF